MGQILADENIFDVRSILSKDLAHVYVPRQLAYMYQTIGTQLPSAIRLLQQFGYGCRAERKEFGV